LLVSCRKVNPKKKWKKGQKLKCLLVHLRRPILRDSFAIKCELNQVVVLKEGMKVECKATRIKGVLFSELRNTNVHKILSLGDYVL
jgi:ribosomal protein L14